MRSLPVVLFCVLTPFAAAAAEEAKCCFTNPAYTGICEVTPAKDETCQSILGYLNTPNSTGKGYCGGTSVRGGWQQGTCKSDSRTEDVAHRAPSSERGGRGRTSPGAAHEAHN